MTKPGSIDASLDEADLRLRLALQAARIGIWEWDIATGAMDYSARAREICGFPAGSEISIDDVRRVTHPEDLPRTSEMARRALDPVIREKPVFEYRILKAGSGEQRWVRAHGEAIFGMDDAGLPAAMRYVGMIWDITDRKGLEYSLEEAQLAQRLAIDAAHMAVWELDIRRDALMTSPELNRLFGFAEDEIPSVDQFRQCYLSGERDKVRQAAMSALGLGQSQFEVEFRIQRRDTATRWLLLRAQVSKDTDDNFDRVVGVVMDIDDRKQSEEQREILLRELNHRVKNSLSVVLAIASQTFRNALPMNDALDVFRGRVQALAAANDAVIQNDWTGFSIGGLVEQITAPYRHQDSDPFIVSGEDIALRPAMNVPLALVLHELCTNAAKYGALSVPGGTVAIRWAENDDLLNLTWQEVDGPPAAEGGAGFGTRLLRDLLTREFEAFSLEIQPAGAVCKMTIRM
ncbi:MAG: sensor histidine kinase [Neoaquamicrobium sediminum]|uniref:sensor histidine kinase n=1 Tax=Neoaquamicrobium sediminum TaxID=1849104 RepID=UPI0040379B55